MKYWLNANEQQIREKFSAFWKRESLGAPLIFVAASKQGFEEKPWDTNLTRKEWDLLPEWHEQRVLNYLCGTEFLADAMPMASLMVGLDITNAAVLAGGDYDYSSNHDQVYFKKGSFCIELPIKPFDAGHRLVKGLKACYDSVIKAVGKKACVNTPMTLDALSTLYHLQGPEVFLADLLKRPGLVKTRARELTDVYLQFYDYFYEYLLENGYGESGSWLQIFAEGKFESVRCDFSVMLSNEMFEDFVLPEVEQVCDHMDYSLFNMSSVNHARFLNSLSKIKNLNGVFWNPEPYRSSVKAALDILKSIKEKGMCLELVCYTVDDAVYAAKELGPDGLYLYFPHKFASLSEAEEAVERINKAGKKLASSNHI